MFFQHNGRAEILFLLSFDLMRIIQMYLKYFSFALLFKTSSGKKIHEDTTSERNLFVFNISFNSPRLFMLHKGHLFPVTKAPSKC